MPNYEVFIFQMKKKYIPSIFLPDITRCGIFKLLGCDRNDGRHINSPYYRESYYSNLALKFV